MRERFSVVITETCSGYNKYAECNESWEEVYPAILDLEDGLWFWPYSGHEYYLAADAKVDIIHEIHYTDLDEHEMAVKYFGEKWRALAH